jgi:NAD(P)-dependent dehydrogenase (short-subunit alcohol dehydrogenase family)
MGENNSCSLGQRGMLKCYPAGSCFFPISLFELLTTVQGFGDAQDFSRALPALPNGAPPRPNMLTVDVCLTGVIYTAYIALHYFRKVPLRHGSLILQASVNGLWANPRLVLYSAAKHGVCTLETCLCVYVYIAFL